MTLRKLLLTTACAVVISTAAFAGAEEKKVWGGGDPSSSAYSGIYVPHVIDVLSKNRLAGYVWGGKSQGTVENAEHVSKNPTHLAVGQLDILKGLQGSPLPPGAGSGIYNFTILHQDIGPECLYAVTAQEGYETWGHVLNNAWDISIYTGGESSGSYGTLQRLMEIYTDLQDAEVVNAGGTETIIESVANQPSSFGFFVMRPDPNSKIFKQIDDLGLTLVPVVDFDLEGLYDFKELKIAHGGLLSDAKYHTTACTTVALITGSLDSVPADDTRTARRLKATIERIGGISSDDLKPNTATWRDMWDNMKAASTEKLGELMEKSKAAIKEAAEKVNN